MSPPIPDPQSPIPEDLTQQAREQLLLGCDRQHRGVIERLRLSVVGEVTMICAASLADVRVVQDQLLGAIRHILAELGAPIAIRLTTQAAP